MAAVRESVKQGDIRSNLITLKAFLQDFPASGEARYLLGLQFTNSGQPAAAVIELERAFKSGYSRDLVVPLLAQALIDNGNGARALSQFKDFTLEQPQAVAQLKSILALALAQQGDRAGAVSMVDAALAADPKSGPALLMCARFAADGGDTKHALALVAELLEAHPQDPDAWTFKGELLLKSNPDSQAAVSMFKRALEFKPEHVRALSSLTGAYIARGEYDLAKAQHATLRKVAPNNLTTAYQDATLAFVAGEHERARGVLDQLLRAAPESIQVLVLAGENHARLGSLTQAEAMLGKALALAPNSTVSRRLLGQIQLRSGQIGKALTTLTPLSDRADAPPEVVALVAEAQLLNGDSKAADSLYKRLAKMKPADPALRTAIARWTLGQGADEAALTELRAIARDDAGSSADLALISAEIQRGAHAAALAAIDGLVKKQPKAANPLLLRGQVLQSQGDEAGARGAWEAALKLQPDYMPALAALANSDLRAKKPDAARKRFADLLTAQPANGRALLALASLDRRLGAPRTDVLKGIEAAVAAAPTDPAARAALVAFHFEEQSFDAALTSAQAAVTALPDNADLLELLARCQVRKREFSQALSTYGKVGGLLPGSPRGQVGMTDVHLAAGDLGAARTSIQNALLMAPNHPESLAQAVLLAMRQGQPAKALESAKTFQSSQPGQGAGWVLEGDIEASRSNWPAAIKAFRTALGKKAFGAAPIKLQSALRRAGKLDEARTVAAQWLAKNPDDTQYLFLLGTLEEGAGELQQARRHYEALLALQPEHALALNNLAMMQIQAKQPGAVALAERAVRAAPRQATLLDTLARAQAQEKLYPAAIETQLRAVAMAPGSPDLKLALARLRIEAGDTKRARTELLELSRTDQAFAKKAGVDQLLQSISPR